MGQMTNAFKISSANSKWKRRLGRSTRRWEDNIKMHLKQRGVIMWTILCYSG